MTSYRDKPLRIDFADRGGLWPWTIGCAILGCVWGPDINVEVRGWSRYVVHDCKRCSARQCVYAIRREDYP